MVGLAGNAVGDDAGTVRLEGGRIQTNADRALLEDVGGEGLLAVGEVLEGLDGGADGKGVDLGGLAGGVEAAAGGVGVGRLGDDLALAVSDKPLVGLVHQAAVAGGVGLVAADELLLGEANEGVAGEEVLALDVGDDGEGPAGAAGALVLDRGHGALGAPVDDLAGGGEAVLEGGLNLGERGAVGDGLLEEGGVEHAGGELLLGEVGEGVGAEGGLGVGALVDGGLLHIEDEVGLAGGLLGDGLVGLEVGGLELGVHRLEIGLAGGGESGGGEEGGDKSGGLHFWYAGSPCWG